MIGDSVADQQLHLFVPFNYIFVAPRSLAQLQPLFIVRRDIFETREIKSKTYSWVAFVTGLVASEIPYLVVCAILYFFCFYYTSGFPSDSTTLGAVFFVMLLYQLYSTSRLPWLPLRQFTLTPPVRYSTPALVNLPQHMHQSL